MLSNQFTLYVCSEVSVLCEYWIFTSGFSFLSNNTTECGLLRAMGGGLRICYVRKSFYDQTLPEHGIQKMWYTL